MTTGGQESLRCATDSRSCMRFRCTLTAGLVTCLALSISGVANAHPIDRHKPGDMPAAPALHMVHYWRDVTWHWQDLDPTAARTPYLWVADGHGVSSAYRWKLAWTWYYRQVAAHKHYEKWRQANV